MENLPWLIFCNDCSLIGLSFLRWDLTSWGWNYLTMHHLLNYFLTNCSINKITNFLAYFKSALNDYNGTEIN